MRQPDVLVVYLSLGEAEPRASTDQQCRLSVNFNWEPSPDHLIYAGVTTSYRAGGFNMGGSDNRVETGGLSSLVFYGDEDLTAYEIGFKSSFGITAHR